MADGEFDNLTVNNILTIGADTTLYRSATDVLSLGDGDSLQLLSSDGLIRLGHGVRAANRAELHLHANGESSVSEIMFGYNERTDANVRWAISDRGSGDASLLFYAGPYWTGTGFSTIMQLRPDGQVRLPVTGSSGGLLIGGDATLYRSAANELKTDDSFVAGKLQLYTGSEFVSSAGDNFHLRTYTNTPNPNLTIGYGNGSGSLDSSLEYLSMNAGYINLVNAHVKLTDGKELQWSDVNLYRSAADKLQTDDTFKAYEVQIEHASAEGPALLLSNPNKTGLGNYWSIYNMTGGYGDSLQFWVYGGEGWGPRLVLTDAGQLKLPIQGSSGGGLDIAGHAHFSNSTKTMEQQDFANSLYGRTPIGGHAGTGIDQYIQFYNPTTDISAYLFTVGMSEDSEPVLYWDRALAVYKDIVAGGRLDSMEGIVSLAGGIVGWGPEDSEMPFVWLTGRLYDKPELDTLEIRTSVWNTQEQKWNWFWGDLGCRNIIAHANGDKLNDETYENVSISHDNGDGWIISHAGALYLGSEDKLIMPVEDSTYDFGSDSCRWDTFYGLVCDVYYCFGADSLDDLSLAKNYRLKTVSVKDKTSGKTVDREVIDPASLEPITNGKSWNLGAMCGFLLGCVKQLTLKVEQLEARLQSSEKS